MTCVTINSVNVHPHSDPCLHPLPCRTPCRCWSAPSSTPGRARTPPGLGAPARCAGRPSTSPRCAASTRYVPNLFRMTKPSAYNLGRRQGFVNFFYEFSSPSGCNAAQTSKGNISQKQYYKIFLTSCSLRLYLLLE